VGASIENAISCLYIYFNALDISDEGYNFSNHHVYSFPDFNISNLEWTEGTGSTSSGDTCSDNEYCYNKKPTTTEQYNSTFEDTKYFYGGTGEPTGWFCWNSMNMINKSINDNDKNITILFNPHDYFGDVGASDYIYSYSKEDATVATRPYLNITYSAAGGDTCDYSSGEWKVDCSEYCTIDTDTNIGSNHISFTGTGEIYLNAIVSLSGDVFIANPCKVVIADGKGFNIS